jgi:hypothetical protein
MSTTTLTAKERLTITRRALVSHMNRDHPAPHDDAGAALPSHPQTAPDSKWLLLKQTVISWWRHHPASFAFDVAQPLLGKYAKAHPVKLLGMAAGVGALVVVAKPWRLFSLGGILLSVIKSADISTVVMSLINRPRQASPTSLHHPE